MRAWEKFVGQPLGVLVTTVLLVALAGCNTGPRGAHPASGAAGDFAGPVDIGNGRHLYLQCRGRGAPTIILESGYHNSSDPWSQSDAAAPAVGPAVLPALARSSGVRRRPPGTVRSSHPPTIADRSSPVSMPRTAQDVVADLHALLDAAHLPGPYILVGHWLGGLFIGSRPDPPRPGRGIGVRRRVRGQIPDLMGSDWPAYRQALDDPPPQISNSPAFEEVDIDRSVAQVAAAPPSRPSRRLC